MPPRFVTVLVVLFWLGTSAWFFQRELWPSLRGGDPPPFVIDLVDEARQLPIDWHVLQGDKKVGKASTQIAYDQADDTFRLEGTFELNYEFKLFLLGRISTKAKVENMYRVTREGELLEVKTHATLTIPSMLGEFGGRPLEGAGGEQTPPGGYEIKGEIAGPVRDGSLQPTGKVVVPGEVQEIQFDPVPLSGRGSVLNPLHPVNRLRGLRPGRTWQIPLFDPLALLSAAKVEAKGGKERESAVLAILGILKGNGSQFRRLNATVLDGTQSLFWDDHEETCQVIEYRDGDLNAHTWVRQRDGTVLQQEANLRGDQIVLKRVSTK
jgi:hypothetical protein